MKPTKKDPIKPGRLAVSRRTAIKGLGTAGLAAAVQLAPGFVRYTQAQTSEPLKLGFQVHRTGIGAAYGRWYERTTRAALASREGLK